VNFLTIACADVERMADFLRALGWPESSESEPAYRLFSCTNGVVVALYGAENYERNFGARGRRARLSRRHGDLRWSSEDA